MAPEITIKNFSFRYSASTRNVLTNFTTNIPAGICCAVLGPTGGGKTTLLQALSGILGKHHSQAIASGAVVIGKNTYNPLPKHILFPAVGLALQDPYVQISGIRSTVFEEIAFTLENLGEQSQEAKHSITPILGLLGINHLAHRKPAELSGGELQRVALATILVAQPTLFLLDEPTNALDNVARAKLKAVLRSLKGKATIIVSDISLDFSLGLADMFIVLNEGKVLFEGNEQQLLNHLHQFAGLLPTKGWSHIVHHLTSQGTKQDRAAKIISKSLHLI
ncbi:MAG: energy-coupling factor ABC transporter ATP-binding protein [Ignavibacteriales bacterium]|nr:energy-coupling factor ABC transporter ATP-binding protein [Ignavibacteriales bacterium]